MMASIPGCTEKPSRPLARSAVKAPGQPPTIAATAGSGAGRTRARVAGPAARSSPASISPTFTESPGGLMPRSRPSGLVSMVMACRNQSTAWRGEQTQTEKSSGTGNSVARPSSGSRRMAETKEDAALFGRPGRMMTVGRRIFTASRKPLREASCSSSSPTAFSAP